MWGNADMVLKVKEPVAEEYHRMREGLTLFTYLHLAADKPLTEELMTQGHRDRLRDGAAALGRAAAALPDVRGRRLPGAPGGRHSLMKAQGGRGVLMGGVGGVANAKVVIIGAGVSGQNAANIALGMGADVTLLDTDLDKLRMSFWRYNNRVHGLASSQLAIGQQVMEADMVIGAVLIPGAAAPKLVSNELVSQMKPGSVLVDIAVDQGGCFEDTHATTHADPTYEVHDSIFYCVANMPGAVPNTSTYALTNATMPYAVALADKGWQQACRDDPSLALGLNTHDGQLTNATGRRGRRHRGRRPRRGARLTRSSRSRPRARKDIPHAVRTYLDHLTVERGLAANTLTSYRRDLRRYQEYLAGQGIDDLDEVTEPMVSSFLVALREGGPDHPPLSSTSAARTVVAVRGFHKFAVADGLATVDPAAREAPGPGEAAAEGAAAGRRRGDPRGLRRAGYDARAARPGAAGGALRHRGPDL